jgi:hypothetical protein
MSEMWEQGQDPGQAEVHEPIVDEDALWDHEMLDEGEENDRIVYEDLDAAYHMLDELQQVLIEVAGDHDLSEEIDRGNMASLLEDLNAIRRVRDLFLTEMDPR